MDTGKEIEFSSLGLHRFVTDEDMKLEIKMERPELEPERQPQRTEEACLSTQLEMVAQGLTATLQHIKEEANEGLSSQRWEGQWQKFLNKSQAPLLDQGNISLSKPVMQTNVKETQPSFEGPMDSSHWSNGQNIIQTRSAFTGMAKDAQSLNFTNRRGSEPTKESEKEDPTYLECQRQRFRQFSYQEAKGPWEAYCQLRKFCHHWLMPELHTKEEILELVILEQFLAILPQEMLSWIRERDSESCFHAVALAEHFLLRQRETELQDQPATGIKQEAAVNFSAGEGALLDVTLQQLYKEVKQEGGGDTNQTPCNGGQKEGDGLLLERKNCQDLPEASPIQVEPMGHLGHEAEEHGNACISSQDRSPFEAAIQPTLPKVKRPSDHLFHGLNRHQRPHTEGELHVCTDCGKAFISKAGFFTHIRIHGREKPYECSDCGKNFRRSSHLNSHSKIHAGVKPFKCLDCGKGFSRSSNLISHQRMHTGEKPYACSSCSKQFCDKSSLVRHERLHTGDKPFKCTECGKSFSQSHHLITHQRSHTGEKPYKCLLCNKSFCDRSTYIRHQKNHTGEKIFKCSHCGESFSRNKHLTRHQSIHTARELHTCSDCGESFCRRSGLKMHQKIHTGEKPYECPDCGKKFNRSTNLISHQRIHTGERPYGCPDCGKRFNRRTHLVSHQKTHGQRKEMTGRLGAGEELPSKVAYESPPYIITTV